MPGGIMLLALLIPLVIVMVVYCAYLAKAALAQKAVPKPEALLLGAVTNFFDTLGIGCYAPTMAWFKLRKLVPDKLIPCTMIVGHTPPAMLQGVIFLALLGVGVDPVLLIGCVVAVLLGGIVGAPLVMKSRVWLVQAVVGLALLIAGGFYALTNLGLMPGGGTAGSLPLGLMILAIGANFIFGVLLNFGIGNYAPTLAMLSLMGMDPRLSFPIMAAGAGMAGAAAGMRHISMGHIDLRIAVGLAVGGIPAVLIAAFVVKAMPLEILRWLVFAVVIYAAVVILRAAARGYRDGEAPAPAPIG